jgi:hypothetical protein
MSYSGLMEKESKIVSMKAHLPSCLRMRGCSLDKLMGISTVKEQSSSEQDMTPCLRLSNPSRLPRR